MGNSQKVFHFSDEEEGVCFRFVTQENLTPHHPQLTPPPSFSESGLEGGGQSQSYVLIGLQSRKLQQTQITLTLKDVLKLQPLF